MKESKTNAVYTGVAWTTLASILLKLFGVFSQFFLGWLLSVNDFAVYAIAISIGSIFTSIRSGGIQRILVQQGEKYASLASPLFKIGLLFNIFLGSSLIFFSEYLSKFYDSGELRLLLILIAVNTVLGTPLTILIPKLQIDLRFKELSYLSIFSSALKTILVILFAALGFGPLSFVLPLILITLLETAVLFYLCGRWGKGLALSRTLLTGFLSSIKWIGMGGISLVLMRQGDYLILGRLESKEVVGMYYFGYQLIYSLSAIITSNFGSVFLPMFAQMKDDPNRLRNAYVSSIRTMAFFCCPFFILIMLLVDPLVTFLWSGKWDSAIIVAQILGVASSVHVLSALSLNLLASTGKWKLWSTAISLGALGLMCSVFIGSVLGGLTIIAIAVCINNVIVGFSWGVLSYVTCEIKKVKYLRDVVITYLISLFSGLFCLILQKTLVGNTILALPIVVIIFVTVYLLMQKYLNFSVFDESTKNLRKFIASRR